MIFQKAELLISVKNYPAFFQKEELEAGYYIAAKDESAIHGPYDTREEAIYSGSNIGLIAMDEVPFRYVTGYTITRHYGGPEEGGWWYDHYEPVCSIPLADGKDAAEVQLFLEKHLAHLKEGDINSVLGGTDLLIRAELVREEHATKQRPQYS